MSAPLWHVSSLREESQERLEAILSALTDAEALHLLHDWGFVARDNQLPPATALDGASAWVIWLCLAGRGFGKTRTGAEWVRARVKSGKARRIHLIAPTASDARKVMVEGDSGLMSVCWPGDRMDDGTPLGYPEWSPGNKEITWSNGAIATLFSAEEPERLRGPQADTLWCDELAAWSRMQDTWDMAMFGFRLGDPQAIVTTTPKALKLIRELVEDPLNAVSRGSTYENRANLARTFFTKVVSRYEGTRLGRQELGGEILEDVEGALWRPEIIRRCEPREYIRIVIGVDPSAKGKSVDQTSAECGIVAVAMDYSGRGAVLADRSGKKTPFEWASTVSALFEEMTSLVGRDRVEVVAEGNQGGEMVRHTLHSVNPEMPVEIVHASLSKQARAEPVSTLYEQDMVQHQGVFSELEDQLCTWEPLTGMPSPDRLDALVWAVTYLMIGHGELVFTQPDEAFVVKSLATK